MLAKDHLVLAEILLRCVSLQILHGHLILKEFFGGRLKSLLLDRTWHVAFLKDAAWDKNVIIDLVIIGSHLVRR